MATASLSKFTVPLSTNQSATSQGLLMPKLKFRFRVTFENFGVSQPSTELTKQVIDFTRPKLSFEEMIIPIYNSKVYLAGKPTWETVVCTLRDDAGGEVTKRVGEQLQKQFDFMEQASASSGIDYKSLHDLKCLMVVTVCMKQRFLKLGNYMVAIYQTLTTQMLTMQQTNR